MASEGQTAADRLIGSVKWGTIGSAVGGLGGVGLGILARKGKFGKEAARYAKKTFPFIPHKIGPVKIGPATTHAITGAGAGSKIGTVAGLVIGRKKPKDTKELSAMLDDIITFK